MQQPLRLPFDPYAFARRHSHECVNVGGKQVPRVVCDLRQSPAAAAPEGLADIGYAYVPALDKYNFSDVAADFAYFGTQVPPYELPGGLKPIYDAPTWRLLRDTARNFPHFHSPQAFQEAAQRHASLNFVSLTPQGLPLLPDKAAPHWHTVAFVLRSEAPFPAFDFRAMCYALAQSGSTAPVILALPNPQPLVADTALYNDDSLPQPVRMTPAAKIQLALASSAASLLVDGLVDGLWMEQATPTALSTAFGMLQLARLRITKTEYISCPSCGRTLFDLQETTARIRQRTEHLKGVKIGIMGCIVNGPGEMADADYGYVGVGPDKIALYRGKEVVMQAVRTAEAVDKLIDLIREDGNWAEPA